MSDCVRSGASMAGNKLGRALPQGVARMRVGAQVQIALLVFACLDLAVSACLSESHQSECGPPLFGCSRSDLKVTQPDAKPVPDFGGPRGEGPVFHDPLYNDVEIVRCTNAFSNPAQPNGNYSVGLGGAGDKNSWNTDNTFYRLPAVRAYR